MTQRQNLKLIPQIEDAETTEFVKKDKLTEALSRANQLLISHQFKEGYWWYTLEANESINAEYILLTHYVNAVDRTVEAKIARRIKGSQREDGSWPLYFEGSGDISTTVECYFALKLAGEEIHSSVMTKARDFIRTHGGISQCRVFTRIHLAQFGIFPWSSCPAMPPALIHLPVWFPVNVYEFSSWARACIIPLLVIMDQKKTKYVPTEFQLGELFVEESPDKIDWSFKTDKGFLSLEQFFIKLDKFLHFCERFNVKPFRKSALKKCEEWICEHISRTEDIYPALAYGAAALHSLGHRVKDHPTLKKCLKALQSFHMQAVSTDVPAIPKKPKTQDDTIYQQCCISPVWDTPWAGLALVEAGESPSSPSLLKTGRWLLSKQIVNFYGDWAQKNKKGKPGGWSFEFENDFFPDVDDVIEVLQFLNRLELPEKEIKKPFNLGVEWLLSMQSKNGGWAAFDVDNTKKFVNRIPFSDHGACSDPPTPDITGRMIELLMQIGYARDFPAVKKAIRFLEKTQEKNGAWEGRWGVNYIYGTWCVLQGLNAYGYDLNSTLVQKAVTWLKSIQRTDGGFGESCHSYIEKKYIPVSRSVPSQTAWALMGLIAAGEAKSLEAKRAARFLIETQNDSGGWDEEHFTGTGFPGHFYIRYHGYRHYFPLLALAKYQRMQLPKVVSRES